MGIAAQDAADLLAHIDYQAQETAILRKATESMSAACAKSDAAIDDLQAQLAHQQEAIRVAREALGKLVSAITAAKDASAAAHQDKWEAVRNSVCTPARWHEVGWSDGVLHFHNAIWDAIQHARSALSSLGKATETQTKEETKL